MREVCFCLLFVAHAAVGAAHPKKPARNGGMGRPFDKLRANGAG